MSTRVIGPTSTRSRPLGTKDVDAVVGVAGVSVHLLGLFEPGVDRVPGHGDVARGVGLRLGGRAVHVVRGEGVGGWPARAVDQQHALAVDQGPAALYPPHAPGERLDVSDLGRHRGRETARRPAAEWPAARAEAHIAVRSSRALSVSAKGRTIASTVNDAMRSPPSVKTRHSACVMPSPANVEWWW